MSQAVVGFGNVAQAYLSGTHDIRAFTISNAVGSIAAAGMVALLSYAWGLRGAAAGCAAIALMPAVAGMIAAARRIDYRALRTTALERDRVFALLRFGGSIYLAAAAVPLAWVYIRSDLAFREGWAAVGLWQSVTRISDAYMQVFGVIFMNYALPQLAAAPSSDRRRRLRQIAALIFSLFASGSSILYIFRGPILRLGFSPAFENASVFLAPQIFGDAFKLGSLLLVYYLLSRNRAWVQASMEVLQAVLMVALYLGLVESLGRRSAVISYAIATPIVAVATLVLASRKNPTTSAPGESGQWRSSVLQKL